MTDSLRLTWLLKGHEHKHRVTTTQVRVGRDGAGEVVIDDERTSWRHAKFEFAGGRWRIHDLESKNGTFVNGRRIKAKSLKDGDVVRIAGVAVNVAIGGSQRTEPKVVLFDDKLADSVTHRISVEDFRNFLDTAIRTDFAPEKKQPAESWVVATVLRAARTLLTVKSTDDLLESVLDIVFTTMRAGCGVIGLIDPKAPGTLEFRVSRSRDGTAAETISVSKDITSRAIESKSAVLFEGAAVDGALGPAHSGMEPGIRAAMCAPIIGEKDVEGVIYVHSTRGTKPFDREHLSVLSVLAHLCAIGIERLRIAREYEREKALRAHLSRYMSRNVVDKMCKTGHSEFGKMRAETRDLTVVFADLSGFTTMAENLAPTEVARRLNLIFEKLVRQVFAEGGTLDKFMGDALMAFFGAPEEQPDHALRAVRAAIAMQKELERLNRDLRFAEPIRMRIGINTGAVVVGDIGSTERRDYTVIGDTVNVASRLESRVAVPGEIVVGERTHEMICGVFACEDMGEQGLKGKKAKCRAYRVVRTE